MRFPTIQIDPAPPFPLLTMLGYALLQRKQEQQKQQEQPEAEQEDRE